MNPNFLYTHAPETALSRSVTFDQNHSEYVTIATPGLPDNPNQEKIFWVDGVEGNKVPTVQSFLVYLRMLEEDIRSAKVRVIDATEGGALIQGTIVQPLRETLQNEQKNVLLSEIMTELLARFAYWQGKPSEPVQRNLRAMVTRRVALAREGLQYLNSRPKAALNELEERLEYYHRQIFSDPMAEYLLENAAPQELFEFLKLGPANATPEQQRQQLRNRFSALLNAVTHAEQQMQEWFLQ